jgi:CRISPR-associated protein Cas1
MATRILEIQSAGNFLNVSRGHLVISRDKLRVGSVPLADIAVLLISNNACSLSAHVISSLAANGAQIVLCNERFTPAAIFLPTQGLQIHAQRLALQIQAKLPIRKRLWAECVSVKIKNQAAVLEYFGACGSRMRTLAKKVRAGDPSNLEGQAARLYWRQLFGESFRRDKNGAGINAILNYGYTVLRAAMIRAIVSAGLHPGLSIHHSAKQNPAALADDLVEMFRPLVDALARRLFDIGLDYITPESKGELASLLTLDFHGAVEVSTVPLAMHDLCLSLVKSLQNNKTLLFDCSLDATLSAFDTTRSTTEVKCIE